MKKVFCFASVLFVLFSVSCEPELITNEDEITEKEFYSVDRTKVERPGSQGQ